LKQYGQENIYCPYFLSKKLIEKANIIVYNYLYMLDPNIKDNIPFELKQNTVVIFDEAHNIDNICLEAFSVNLNQRILDGAQGNLEQLSEKVNLMQAETLDKLENEYKNLL